MKKFTFILLALISGTAFAQSTASDVADVNAEIVSPISIVAKSNMNFGSIASETAAGVVVLKRNGVIDMASTTAAVITNAATTTSAAQFEISAANTYSYSIDVPDIQLTGAGDAMNVTFDHNLKETGNVSDGTAATLNIGGTLAVNANQTPGSYSGEVKVTVSYE